MIYICSLIWLCIPQILSCSVLGCVREVVSQTLSVLSCLVKMEVFCTALWFLQCSTWFLSCHFLGTIFFMQIWSNAGSSNACFAETTHLAPFSLHSRLPSLYLMHQLSAQETGSAATLRQLVKQVLLRHMFQTLSLLHALYLFCKNYCSSYSSVDHFAYVWCSGGTSLLPEKKV